MPTKSSSPLARFLLTAFLDWQRESGERRSMVKFAEHLGLKTPTLTKLMRGEVEMPDRVTIEAIAGKCGDGVYDALGLARPDPLLRTIIAAWGGLSLEQQRAIVESIGIVGDN